MRTGSELLSGVPIALVGAALACILAVLGEIGAGRRRRSDGSVFALVAWLVLGLAAGYESAAPSVRPSAGSGALLHLVQVAGSELRSHGLGWKGTLHASWTDGTWVVHRSSLTVIGPGDLPEGSFLVRGRCRPASSPRSWAAPPSRLYLASERAYLLADSGEPNPAEPPESASGDPTMAPPQAAPVGWRRGLVLAEDRVTRVRGHFARVWTLALGPDAGTFAAWALLGVRPSAASSWQRPFIQTGTLHLLAISGLHLGLLGAAFWLITKIALRGWRGSRWVALVALALYGAAVGLPASVQRALAMAWIAAAGPTWGRGERIWNAVGWVAALLPIIEPDFPGKASFQLSLGATCGVLLGARWASRIHRLWERRSGPSRIRILVLSLAGTSVGASLVTLPWSFHHFGEFYPLGVLANLLAIPIMALVLPCLALGGLCALCGAGSDFAWVAIARALGEAFLSLIQILSAGCGSMPWRGELSYETALASSIGFAGFLWLSARGSRWCAVPLGVLATSVLAAWPASTLPVRIRFLEVGQGDAILVQLPEATWLVDTGPPRAGPGHELVPALLRQGVRRIDRVWFSHGDLDHWGQLGDLLESVIPVDTITIATPAQFPDRFWETLERAPQHPQLVTVVAPWTRTLARAVTVRLHHPTWDVSELGRNDRSLVMEIGAGPTNFLLVGDLESAGERHLRERAGVPRALLTQAGHHGSSTSGQGGWYDQVSPVLAVASLGLDNRFGFPHQGVLEALATRDVRLLRTDLDGAVTIELDRRFVRVRRARPRLTTSPEDP